MGQRVAIIDGCRTPFTKAGTDFLNLSSLDLAKAATSELINKTELDPESIDEVIMGTVFPPAFYPNLAREIVIGLGLPTHIPGYTIGRACSSSVQSLTSGAESIMLGRAAVIISGGAESLSQLQVPYPKEVVLNLQKFARAKSITDKLAVIAQLPFKEFIPSIPDITELSTGLSMGQHAELMARKNNISREEQDKYSYESHRKAAKAMSEGKFSKEIAITYSVPDYKPISEDNNLRKEPNLESMAKLKPAFDKQYGTITAANSSPLTDGGSAVLIMSEDKAKELGYTPKAYIKEYAYVALDPHDQLLLGNAYAIPKVLDKAKLSLNDMDFIEMHEAFAAQVLSTIKALASKKFAEEKLGKSEAVGEINPEIFNINGGSLALGHPFGATGGRIVTTMANELQSSGKQYGLLSICAAGGMSVAMILERA
jgi:acetyl-CoA acyltransferase